MQGKKCALLCLGILASLSSLLSIAGCGGASNFPVTTASTFTGTKLSGQVKSVQPANGQPQNAPQPTVQEPVTGATIQLYQVGTTGDGSSATPLGTSTTTDPTGSFNITGDYNCPGSNPLVYLLATGGNPGLTGGTDNTGIVLIAALGSCNALPTRTDPIYLTEVTTVAAIAALAPFMTSPTCTTAPTCIGSGTSDASALAAAFTLAAEYANTASGTSPGNTAPAGDAAPGTLINTLADIMSACVNTTGGSAGDGSNCGTLFTDSTPSGGAAPSDITTALLNILNNPTNDITPLFALLSSTQPAPFGPVLTQAPSSLAVSLQPITFSSTLPAGTVGTAYAGSVTANNAQGTTTYSLASGALPASGDLVLNPGTGAITGTPQAADVGTYNFSVKVVDQYGDTATSGSLSIVVNPVGGQISGQVFLSNGCGVSTLPAFTVSLYTSPGGTFVTSTTTNTTTGAYTFSNVAAGAYTITPTIPGATSSLFRPASYTGSSAVTVSNGSNISGKNFGAVVGYTVSGNVAYTSTPRQSGQTYLVLNNVNCSGSGGSGTSIANSVLTSGGAFSIRGVPPGNYTLSAWMDSVGQGAQNANDPTGGTASFLVPGSTSGSVAVTIANPTIAAPNQNPPIDAVIPTATGFLIAFQPSTSITSPTIGEEDATVYTVNWSTSPNLSGGAGTKFQTVAGTHNFKANGTNTNVWILNNTVTGANSFVSGQTYYFQTGAENTAGGGNLFPPGWATYTAGGSSPAGVPIGLATCSTNCTTVSGAVTIPSSVSLVSGAPLYVGLYQSNNNGPTAIYALEIAPNNVVIGGSGNSYSITVPSNSVTNTGGYALFGILDQNVGKTTFGVVEAPGEVTNLIGGPGSFTTTGSSMTENLPACTDFQNGTCMPYSNSAPNVLTQYFSSTCSGCSQPSTSYQIELQVGGENKLPVAVTLVSPSPNLMSPIDLGNCIYCGNGGGQYQYTASLPGGTPNVGDTYTFSVTYSDGSTNTQVGSVTGFGSTGQVVGFSGTNGVATNLQTTAGTAPKFTWTFPSNPADFAYSFYMYQSNCSGSCNNTWQIPGNNSNSNGFTYAQTETGATTGQITWGTDPTGGGSTPSGSGLCSGVLCSADDYNWIISVYDGNGNSAQTQVSDNNP